MLLNGLIVVFYVLSLAVPGTTANDRVIRRNGRRQESVVNSNISTTRKPEPERTKPLPTTPDVELPSISIISTIRTPDPQPSKSLPIAPAVEPSVADLPPLSFSNPGLLLTTKPTVPNQSRIPPQPSGSLLTTDASHTPLPLPTGSLRTGSQRVISSGVKTSSIHRKKPPTHKLPFAAPGLPPNSSYSIVYGTGYTDHLPSSSRNRTIGTNATITRGANSTFGTFPTPSCGGCRVNVESASVFWWFYDNYYHASLYVSSTFLPNGSIAAMITPMKNVKPFNITAEAQSAKLRVFQITDVFVPNKTYIDWDLVTPTNAAPSTTLVSLAGYNPIPEVTTMAYSNFTEQVLISQPIAKIPITARNGDPVTFITEPQNIVFFSEYEIVHSSLYKSRYLTTCLETTTTVPFQTPIVFDYDGPDLLGIPFALGQVSNTWMTRPEFGPCTAGYWFAVPTVIMVVRVEIFMMDYTGRFGMHTEETVTSLDKPTDIKPDFPNLPTVSGFGFNLNTSMRPIAGVEATSANVVGDARDLGEQQEEDPAATTATHEDTKTVTDTPPLPTGNGAELTAPSPPTVPSRNATGNSTDDAFAAFGAHTEQTVTDLTNEGEGMFTPLVAHSEQPVETLDGPGRSDGRIHTEQTLPDSPSPTSVPTDGPVREPHFDCMDCLPGRESSC
ncbi:hypothetical protein P152DRAFT_46621 [Eremomyces bilateralis CBS 781.70]|uniref:Uncharacterized protein n=1 Tax=Eremomyces bilateralis CBS 781.70 TaxID=1392243 RepID=A0A6G1G1X7_9PEZI|nr:uncharacterized protein P152DRAFT_46621 [Eremomyces bilateralis CBS 781.70]KAF1812115.1 hypothetical protein P152DRAFT_46621 [Eremomyces bilateralis CBS 781.70]